MNKTIIALILTGVLLSGCSLDTTNRTLSVITSATNIAYTYESGETVDDYANLIVMNNQAWSNYAGSIVRKRRYYEKAIAAAQDSDEMNALVAEFENGDHKII